MFLKLPVSWHLFAYCFLCVHTLTVQLLKNLPSPQESRLKHSSFQACLPPNSELTAPTTPPTFPDTLCAGLCIKPCKCKHDIVQSLVIPALTMRRPSVLKSPKQITAKKWENFGSRIHGVGSNFPHRLTIDIYSWGYQSFKTQVLSMRNKTKKSFMVWCALG